MANVFQRQAGKGFWITQWYNENGKRETRTTKTTDKRTALQIARGWENLSAKRREGLVDPRDERYAIEGRRPLTEHLDDFHADLVARGNGEQHCKETKACCQRVIAGSRARFASDLSPSAVQRVVKAMRDAGKSARTANAHIAAAKAFSRWLKRDHRCRDDALVSLEAYNEASDRRHIRRVMTPEELGRLIAAAACYTVRSHKVDGPTRAIVYRVAAGTGFRASEIRSLRVSQFDLDASPPTITVKAAYSKHRRDDVQPIADDLAALLRDFLEGAERDEKPFGRLPGNPARMLQCDLARARAAWIAEGQTGKEIEARTKTDFLTYEDHAGEVATSMRYGTGTFQEW
jgi:integrase